MSTYFHTALWASKCSALTQKTCKLYLLNSKEIKTRQQRQIFKTLKEPEVDQFSTTEEVGHDHRFSVWGSLGSPKVYRTVLCISASGPFIYTSFPLVRF